MHALDSTRLHVHGRVAGFTVSCFHATPLILSVLFACCLVAAACETVMGSQLLSDCRLSRARCTPCMAGKWWHEQAAHFVIFSSHQRKATGRGRCRSSAAADCVMQLHAVRSDLGARLGLSVRGRQHKEGHAEQHQNNTLSSFVVLCLFVFEASQYLHTCRHLPPPGRCCMFFQGRQHCGVWQLPALAPLPIHCKQALF